MAKTYKLLQKVTATNTISSVTFTNIPATYTDLVVFATTRSGSTSGDGIYSLQVKPNNSATTFSAKYLMNSNASVSSGSYTGSEVMSGVAGGYNTAGTFTTTELYISNYASSQTKTIMENSVMEHNGTSYIRMTITSARWTTDAISSLYIAHNGWAVSSGFLTDSTFYLYGVKNSNDGSDGTFGIKATGGDEIYTAGGYRYHVFKSSGTFNVTAPGWAECLIISGGAGGGGCRAAGGSGGGGGGGAGGMKTVNIRLENGAYSVIVGAGGAGGETSDYNKTGYSGSNSLISYKTSSTGGGGGGSYNTAYALSGGSGGGGSGTSGGTPAWNSGANGISGEGYAGGSGIGSGNYPGGGGGGAGGAGANASSSSVAGSGGIGAAWLGTTYAGGGGGGTYLGGTVGSGGSGIGGAGGSGSTGTAGSPGTVNTGSGGGGGGATNSAGGAGGAGGSGIIVIRYPIV